MEKSREYAAVKKIMDYGGVGIRILKAAQVKIYRDIDNLLYAELAEPGLETPRLYRGIFAVLCFPVSGPDRYISLRYVNLSGQEEEIGVIRDPTEFPREDRVQLAKSLAQYYFEFEIERILSIEFKYNLLMFDVLTNFGPRQFEMRWRSDRALSLGEKGKVLLDVFDCRYVVRDVSALPREDQALFSRFIYW